MLGVVRVRCVQWYFSHIVFDDITGTWHAVVPVFNSILYLMDDFLVHCINGYAITLFSMAIIVH